VQGRDCSIHEYYNPFLLFFYQCQVSHQPHQLEALRFFRLDHSIRIPAFSIKAREALSQYIARPPLSLKKMSIEENAEGTVISFASENEFFKGKTETFPVMRFFPELTQPKVPARGHIPPK